jgi:hypothetical protein
MSKRNHDEFSSDYDLQLDLQQGCECILYFQPDEEASNVSNHKILHGRLSKRLCSGLPSQTGLEDASQDYDPLSYKIRFYEHEETERILANCGYEPVVDDDLAQTLPSTSVDVNRTTTNTMITIFATKTTIKRRKKEEKNKCRILNARKTCTDGC